MATISSCFFIAHSSSAESCPTRCLIVNNCTIADDRRPTVNELANQKGVSRRSSGWKLQLFAAEFDALVRTLLICHCSCAHIVHAATVLFPVANIFSLLFCCV